MTAQRCTSKNITKQQLPNEQIWYSVVSIQGTGDISVNLSAVILSAKKDATIGPSYCFWSPALTQYTLQWSFFNYHLSRSMNFLSQCFHFVEFHHIFPENLQPPFIFANYVKSLYFSSVCQNCNHELLVMYTFFCICTYLCLYLVALLRKNSFYWLPRG